uniref:Putative carboxysome peptide B n=1 Tax=uncultured Thiotrichaceae bacterium TaxID=298394 RepID=A0A6S6TQR8_9GAMM|nr:MAG: putative carboxysome peptide B [uncultured Thiotrichaceae bacterium]
MEIQQVVGDLVTSRRVPGLKQTSLRILASQSGQLSVATDLIGVPPGKWVFTAGGSAARHGTGDFEILTDLTILGIIDFWNPGEWG